MLSKTVLTGGRLRGSEWHKAEVRSFCVEYEGLGAPLHKGGFVGSMGGIDVLEGPGLLRRAMQLDGAELRYAIEGSSGGEADDGGEVTRG